MEKTLDRDASAGKKLALSAKQATAQEVAREQVGMRRWLRLTARKTASKPKLTATSGNPAADAAAEALAALLNEGRRHA
jgi:hypothetical protein